MPSQLSGTLPASFKPHLFTVESAVQFSTTLKQCGEYYCFKLNFIYHAAYSGDKVAEVNWHSEQKLDELEKEYSDVFSEPKYPIKEHKKLF